MEGGLKREKVALHEEDWGIELNLNHKRPMFSGRATENIFTSSYGEDSGRLKGQTNCQCGGLVGGQILPSEKLCGLFGDRVRAGPSRTMRRTAGDQNPTTIQSCGVQLGNKSIDC